MSRVYIKFQSEADEVKGFYALATQSCADSLGDLFRVSEADLQLLDNEQVKYVFAPEHEVLEAYQRRLDLLSGKSQKGIKSKVQTIKRWVQRAFTF